MRLKLKLKSKKVTQGINSKFVKERQYVTFWAKSPESALYSEQDGTPIKNQDPQNSRLKFEDEWNPALIYEKLSTWKVRNLRFLAHLI